MRSHGVSEDGPVGAAAQPVPARVGVDVPAPRQLVRGLQLLQDDSLAAHGRTDETVAVANESVGEGGQTRRAEHNDIREGDICEGDIREGDIREGDIREGDIREGDGPSRGAFGRCRGPWSAVFRRDTCLLYTSPSPRD